MDSPPDSRSPDRGRSFERPKRYLSRHGSAIVLLSLFSLVANFLHFRRFGLYEDDWYYIAPAWVIPPQAWFLRMFHTMRGFYAGRPLQEGYLDLAGYLSYATRSISLLYVLAAILYCVTVILMYHVLRLRFPAFFATFAALLFAVSPLTTIRQYIDGTIWSAPAFISLFLAYLLYAGRNGGIRKVLAYALAAMALMTYEPMFFLFAGAPYFHRGRARWREWTRHLAIWSAVLLVYLIVRRRLSEPRLTIALSRDPLETVRHIAGFAIHYTWSSFLTYGYAVMVGLREKPAEGMAWSVAFALPLLGWLLWSSGTEVAKPTARSGREAGRWWIWRGLLPGLALIMLGYAVCYFSSDGVVDFPMAGRATRFSLAAAFGSSIFAAALLCMFLSVLRESRWIWLVRAGGVAGTLALFLYSFVIQDDYVREWALHQSFLAQAMALSPDVTRDTFFVLERSLPGTPFGAGPRKPSIGSEPHGLQVSFERLFENGHGPEVFVAYSRQWRDYLRRRDDGRLYWTQERFPGGWARDTKAPVGPIISLIERDGQLARDESPLYVGGRQVIQIRGDTESIASGSNWNRFSASPLVPFALPGFKSSYAADRSSR